MWTREQHQASIRLHVTHHQKKRKLGAWLKQAGELNTKEEREKIRLDINQYEKITKPDADSGPL